ncbi:MAG: cobalamin biosynthesis protein CobW [Chloroflexi bacterium]|nr:cobalamin biosynthesis protein CobW [Chloroflexota bacterium]
MRSKGICWLATRHELAGMWSQAGQLISLEPAGTWWADAPGDEIPGEMRESVTALIDGDYGDRRQEFDAEAFCQSTDDVVSEGSNIIAAVTWREVRIEFAH